MYRFEKKPKSAPRSASVDPKTPGQSFVTHSRGAGSPSREHGVVGDQAVEFGLQPSKARTDSAPETGVTSHVSAALGASGQPLAPDTRHFMEQRFGHDFSRVRVHDGAKAAESAAALSARAYTLGNSIVFGAGEYAPRSRSGQSLLAHELAHVVQQGDTPSDLQAKLSVGRTTDSSERAADEAAHTALNADITPSSAALQIREQLRTSAPSGPVIRRAVTTWGGEFDTDKYTLTSDPGMDGVDIELRFKPGTNANAELIGLTQTARSLEKGSPVPTKLFGAAAGKALKSRTIPVGEAGAGTRVDRVSTHGNPLYAADLPGAKDTLADTPTVPSWGRHGWRYTDKAGKLQKQDALLKDRPQLPSRMKESKQVFETTALAVKGVQNGTFYGSVQWGWEKDAAGKVKKLPLSLVSQGVPSAVFGRASELWNKGKTSKGKATIDLPVVSVNIITGAGAELYATASDAQSVMISGTPLPVGTRFRILQGPVYALQNPVIHIEIVDGPLVYQRGYILDTVGYRSER